MAILVNVTAAEALDLSTDNVLLDITFTNTESFTYKADSNIYYYAKLTDSTATPKTREVTFTVHEDTGGTIEALASKTFTIDNTTNLVPTIAASDGRICYYAV